MYNLEEMEEEEKLRKQFVITALEKGVQFLQLPCPEFTLYGAKRWGHVSEQFDNVFFKKHCRNSLLPIIEQLVEYKENKERFEILGIVGIDGSPSCGVDYTCTGKKCYGCLGGRDEVIMEVIHDSSLCKGKGVFFKVLEELLVEFELTDIKVEGLFSLEPHKCMNLLG